ncbi:MAG: hypothetical protein GY771_13260 [bacterium]|nr:hypothetical protein [bacterium]
MRLAIFSLVWLLAFTATYGAQVERLANPGFEDGVMTPWTTNGNWAIDTTDPHTGTYCASNEGNNYIEQSFDPTDVNDINLFTLWMKQPESAISAVYIFYGPSDYDNVLNFLSGTDWEEFDMTSDLRNTGDLEMIRIWGYSGGGPDPDISYIDDVSIIYEDYIGIESASLGGIKATFK